MLIECAHFPRHRLCAVWRTHIQDMFIGAHTAWNPRHEAREKGAKYSLAPLAPPTVNPEGIKPTASWMLPNKYNGLTQPISWSSLPQDLSEPGRHIMWKARNVGER